MAYLIKSVLTMLGARGEKQGPQWKNFSTSNGSSTCRTKCRMNKRCRWNEKSHRRGRCRESGFSIEACVFY
jgi:hypothetical protein